MSTIGVGIIGCGGIVQLQHLPTLLDLNEVQIAALADPVTENLAKVASATGVPPDRHYADYRDLLANHALDIVSLALPPTANRDAALAAFAAGAHVMASKPLAANLAQAEDIVAAAKAAGKLLTMGLQNRFTPEVRALRQIVAERRLDDTSKRPDVY